MSWRCFCSDNQDIHDALWRKAASYQRADKPYQARAYWRTASLISTLYTPIYNELDNGKWVKMGVMGIGPSIAKFINDYITSHYETSKILRCYIDASYAKSKPKPKPEEISLYEEPTGRRSARLAAKPKKCYKE
jgi:hypothetical protein